MSREMLLNGLIELAARAMDLIHPAALADEPGIAATLAQIEGLLTTQAIGLDERLHEQAAAEDRAEALAMQKEEQRHREEAGHVRW